MSEWTFNELQKYDDKICEIAEGYGLDWFPIQYEVCDYFEMIGHMSYHGMPTHYPHWSYGKSFERTHQMYNMGAEGLPYELIINSDPAIAYLMRQNPAYLQVLIMAHCVGHSDFFKNNRLFKDTRPQTVVGSFRNARKRVQEYIEDPSIGITKVENILDAAHAIQHHAYIHPKKRISFKEQREEYLQKIKNDKTGVFKDLDINKVPLEPEYDLLGFLIEHSLFMDEWAKDLLEIVRNEAQYFIPQIRTKIMNEGWASYWHYRIMNELDLPQKYHLPFLKSHNQVIRPHVGAINPYHLGFYMFQKIEERFGLDTCFLARECAHDESFLRQYLTEEDCLDLNLFSFSLKSKRKEYSIDDIADEDGWKKVKANLIKTIGINSIPTVYVEDVEPGNILVLQHEHDGRDLDLDYAERVVEHVSYLWGNATKLLTTIEDEPFEI
jgi:stage V sporulation protein R